MAFSSSYEGVAARDYLSNGERILSLGGIERLAANIKRTRSGYTDTDSELGVAIANDPRPGARLR